MKKILSRLATLVSILVIAGSLLFPLTVRAATFNPSNLIDDSVFDNTSTMNAAQIDAWMNANFPNSCISTNSGFSARVPSGYTPSGGFTYGDFYSAGQVIFTAAQTYGLNPQVLLVTLQKEQSIVSGSTGSFCNNGSENKYAAAAGYGCPDGGTSYSYSGISLYKRSGVEHTTVPSTCVNSAAKAGFSQQVIRAAWLLKFGQQRSLGNTSWAVVTGPWDNSDDPGTCYGGPMTEGFRKRCSSDSSAVFYDGYKTIDGTNIHIDTGATAALYWYTPHFSGNQNFFNLFNSWFGSPYGSVIGPYTYRMYNPGSRDHYYTARQNDRFYAKQSGFNDDNPAFNVSDTQAAGMVPIYSLYNGRLSDHWLVPDGMNRYWALNFGGYREDGVAFYAYPANTGNSGPECSQGRAIYQMWHGGFGDHFYTLFGSDRFWALNYGGFVDDNSGSYKGASGSVSFCATS